MLKIASNSQKIKEMQGSKFSILGEKIETMHFYRMSKYRSKTNEKKKEKRKNAKNLIKSLRKIQKLQGKKKIGLND